MTHAREPRILFCPSSDDSDTDCFFGIPEDMTALDAIRHAEAAAAQVAAAPGLDDGGDRYDAFQAAMRARGLRDVEWTKGPIWDKAP